MVFADRVPKVRIGTTATAAGFFLSSDFIHVHFARVASAAVIGRTPGSLED